MKLYESHDETLMDVPEIGKWMDIQVKVVDIWKNKSDTIPLSGIVCDGIMNINFFIWESFEIGFPLISGYLYDFQNVFVNCYPGILQVNVTGQSSIICIEEDNMMRRSQFWLIPTSFYTIYRLPSPL